MLLKSLVELKNSISKTFAVNKPVTSVDKDGKVFQVYNIENKPVIERLELPKPKERIDSDYVTALKLELAYASDYLKNTRWVIDNIQEFNKDKETYHPEIQAERVLVYDYIQLIQSELSNYE